MVTQDWRDETLVYDLETHRAHSLNPPAALVWRSCDGRTAVVGIAKRLAAHFGGKPDPEVVELALRRLGRARLLDHPSGTSRGVTRRRATRTLGRAAAASVLLPTVTSILAPTPAAAATCLPLKAGDPCLATQCGQPCGKCLPGGSQCLNIGGGDYQCTKSGTGTCP